jgi:hypothetical protein
MATSGDVNLTIADGAAGTISVPAPTLQVVLGCSSAGTANAVLATRQPTTLQTTYGYGPLPEASAMTLAAGGTVLAMKIPTTVAGSIAAGSALTVTAATTATPIVITAGTHNLTSGAVVTVAGVGGNTAANGTFVITVLSSTTFSLNNSVGAGAYTSGGTATWTGSMQTGTGTSTIVFSGAAYDELYPLVTITTGGTLGTTGIQFTVSLDAGRSLNLPRISLGTDLTYTIPQTNITITFITAKTVVAGDTSRCHSIAPAWNMAGLTAALLALQNSDYASTGWGSMHIVGIMAAADAGTTSTNLETMATALIYTRAIASARDASPPTAWGGTGETDSAWSTSVIADYATTTSKRLGVAAGYYNMRSSFPNTVAGLPLYRRPLGWAWAARVVSLPTPADHEGWVKLGGLPQITVDQVNDPLDGFVYHDEQATGAVFDNLGGGPGRLTAARKRRGKPGAFFIANPLSLAASGSDYQLIPRGRVMDLASTLIQQSGADFVNGRVKLTPTGKIREGDADALETALRRAIDDGIGPLISGRTIVVDRDQNVGSTSTIAINATIQGDGFALQINVNLAYGTVIQPQVLAA